MARKSSHDHYKEHILTLLRAGKSPNEILAVYPDLPTSTIYRWRSEIETDSNILSNKPQETAKFTVLDGYAEQSDIALARSTLRGILKQRDCPQAVKVQAALGLMKLAYLRSELPRHIIDEDEVRDISTARQAIGSLSDAELMSRIREKLQAPG